MSNLLSQASLVMIPSGYKEDVVYSEIPIDGSGDLQFTRSSNGTRIKSAGLVEVTPWNLVEQSESIGTSPWLTNGATLTSGQTDPSGGTTAVKVQLASGGNNYVYQGIVLPNPINVVSAYLRADSATTIGFSIGGSTANAVNLTTTWQLFTFSSADTSGGIIFDNYFGPSPTQQAKTFYIWHPQLNIGATAKPYFPTTDRLNVPRLTYQNGGGGCPSLLLEKQSTNLVTYSEQFDNADWSKIGSTITANATISPDGTQNADKLIEDTSTGNHRIVNTAFAVNNGNAHSQSWYVKYFNNQWIQLNRGQEGSGYLNFDLINGVVGYTGGITDYQISNMANGWYRISINYVVTGTYATAGISILDTNVNARYESYVGDGTSGVYIWGCQYEQSSYPTSYIPTTSSSATRVADACSKTGISSLIGQTQGVLFVDLVITGTTGNNRFSISDGSNTNWIFIATPEDGGTSSSRFYIKTNGSVAVDVGTSSYLTFGQRYKLALAYKSGDWAVYANGSLLYSGTDSIASVSSALSQFNFFNATGGEADTGEQVNQAILFPTRLTNSELASLTTI